MHCIGTRNRKDLRLLVEEHITNIVKLRNPFLEVWPFFRFWGLDSVSANQLLCIVGDLAGGGSVAVAVGVGNR